MSSSRHMSQRGQALPEYLMTVALVAMLTSMVVVAITPAVIEVVVAIVNHIAVYVSSV